MKKIFYLLALSFSLLLVSSANAAPYCSGNTAGTGVFDPACYTTYSNPGWWEGAWKTCTWTCGYPLSICNFPWGSDFCHGTPSQCESWNPGLSCGSYSSLCYDDCGNGCCHNNGTDTGDTHTAWDPTDTWHAGSTGYTCHYISAVDYTGSPCVDGIMTASAATWSTTSGTDCSNVAITQVCGMCEPNSENDIYKNTTEVSSAPNADLYFKGTFQASSLDFPKYGTEWNWVCQYNDPVSGNPIGAPSPACKASNSYIDIGLRIYDDTEPDNLIIPYVEEETNFSPFQIMKGGHVYSIALSDDISHPWYTNARIMSEGNPYIILDAH